MEDFIFCAVCELLGADQILNLILNMSQEEHTPNPTQFFLFASEARKPSMQS